MRPAASLWRLTRWGLCRPVLALIFTAASASGQSWSIREVHEAFAEHRLNCVDLVQSYLDRIEAYDDRGPALNAILTVNPRALQEAAEMDGARQAGEALGSLHCVPVILKDNYNTADLPTTGGSLTFDGFIPPEDAFVVRKFREAGALILGKSNLTELAMGGTTVSSLGGQTRNPYDLSRTAGGSSGGTGAAVAADFGLVGTGSDTGQSTRSPASANGLIGVRGTRGLISRAGVMPVSHTQDEIGPITRTVEDAARMLDVMVGHDPADPITAFGFGRAPDSYAASLDPDALRGARIGLLMDFLGEDAIHEPVNALVESAVRRMEGEGATVVRIRIPALEALTRDLSLSSYEFGPAFERYLAQLGPGVPVKSLGEFLARGEFHGSIRSGLEAAAESAKAMDAEEYRRRLLRRDGLRQAVMAVISEHQLDAILHPHQQRLVAPIGEAQLDRNGVLSNGTGFPAVTFSGGFTDPSPAAPLGVPVGIELLGPEWSESVLLSLAFAFEQVTQFRRPPPFTP